MPAQDEQPVNLIAVSAVVTTLLTLLACGIVWYWGHPAGGFFAAGWGLGPQIAVGLAIGIGLGVLVALVEPHIRLLEPMRHIVRDIFVQARPSRLDLLLVSLGAGWGEELLFRGALQPHIGIWPAAVLFGIGHFLLTKITWGRLGYTAVLILAGGGLGYLAEWAGLLAAMVCHAFYDFVVLLATHRALQRIPPTP
ncbi:MAG: CPBP family intramembrane metalloprotease [Candidatus Sumerlaeia bacterium]|nr:CPBP family intramembrane metalloprotease [Candidatus Sumerlaeia bacterium]